MHLLAWPEMTMMINTGRLRPKWVPFSSSRYLKGQGFHKLIYTVEVN